MHGGDEYDRQDRPRLGIALRRGVMGRCPNCGQGRLFAGYLKQVAACAACGEAYGHIRSDDAAPWLTILVVGHVLVPVILSFEQNTDWPAWASMTLWPALAVAGVFAVLPRAKGLLMSAIWAMRAPGSERD